nr:tonB-system energizer ExbB [Hyphomicrobium sp. CS1GBMeth3]
MFCSSKVPGARYRTAHSAGVVLAAILAVVGPSRAQEPVPPPSDVTQSQPAPAPSTSETPAANEAAPTPPSAQTEPGSPPAFAPTAPAADAAQPTDAPSDASPVLSQPSEPAASAATDADVAQDGAASTEAAPASGQPAAGPQLPHDLSPWGMYMQADIVVKAVMIGLAFASVVTWTVWLAKSLELSWAKRRVTRAFSSIHAASSLAEAAQRLQGQKGIVLGLIEHAAVELSLSADLSDKDGIKERVSSRLDGLVSAAGRDMNRGTGVLATIGSTAPFVGLFGTVWGIMNSFIGIAETQTTNLAVVAPGIAEALLATAIGLVAAIPAVIIYNHFARQIGGYKAMIAEASAEVMRLVSRDLDRGLRIARPRAAE